MSDTIEEIKIIPAFPITKEERELLSIVDDKESEIVDLLQKLVQTDSMNLSADIFVDKSEIFDFTKGYMDKAGFKTDYFKAPFPSGKKDEFYYNLIASFEGESKGKTLQFNGHLDIVPYNPDNWDEDTPPLGGVIKDGKLYGRGSIDMKAGVACQMMAMKLLKESGAKINGKLQMWFVPDEETHGAYGSKFMPQNHFDVINADATIISEPRISKPMQSPSIGISEKGPHWFKFTFHGAAGHGSWPKWKSNAINKAVRFIDNSKKKLKIPKIKPPVTKKQSLTMLKDRLGLEGLKEFRKFVPEKLPLDKDKKNTSNLYQTTFSFNQIKAGIKTNVIPDTCELEVDFRTMPGLESQDLIDAIVKYCTKLGYKIELPERFTNLQHSKSKFKDEPIDITMSIITIGEGSATNPDSEFGKVLRSSFEAIYEVSPIYSFATGFSDGGNMREAGMKDIFIIGPGGRGAHNANEYADISTLNDITKLYLLVAYRYLKL
ncbi:MAG: M20 family metallopeptidase [Candidatus Heimdallarchaeota archaeon]|nr:M20 family metallopeptidase [Candidatus Heimdallarchaeota archaeon]